MRKPLAWIVFAALAVQGTVLAQSASADPAIPHQTLLSLTKTGQLLDVIDPTTLKVLARIPVGGNPHEVVASADGRRAYVSNYGNGTLNTITVVDLVAQKPLETVDLGPLYGPHGLTFVGNRLWFTAEREKLIGRLDASNHVEWQLGTGQIGTHMLWVAEDQSSMVTVNVGSGTISILWPYTLPIDQHDPYSKYGAPAKRGSSGDPIPDWNETVIKVGTYPEGFDVLHDRQGHPTFIWAANALEGTISVIDARQQRVLENIPAGVNTANRLRFTRDGRDALISGEKMPDVVVIDVASRKVIKRIPVGTGGAGILMDPYGLTAYVSCPADNKVVAINLRTLAVTGHVDTDKEPDGIAWANLDGSGGGVSP